MDNTSQEMFDQIIQMDKDSLSKEQRGFLMARRGYMNDEQRKRFADMIKAHEAGTLENEGEEDENDLSTLSLKSLKAVATEEKVNVKGLKSAKEFIKAIQAHRDDQEG